MADTPKGKINRRRKILLWVGVLLVLLVIFGAVALHSIFNKDQLPKVVKAGPLETSFCQDLPKGLFFGMSREDVVSLMKREPLRDEELKEGIVNTLYVLKEYPHSDVSYAGLAFLFVNKQLYSILIAPSMYTLSKENADDFEDVLFNFVEGLVKQYGPPHGDFTGNIPNARYDSVFLWEFANNALLVGPITVESDGLASFGIVICPLNASGHYDLSNYYRY